MARTHGGLQGWLQAYDLPRGAEDEGHAELGRLGLIACGDDGIPPEAGAFARDVEGGGRRGRVTAVAGEWSLARPDDTTAGLAFLAGLAMIATLAAVFR